MRITTLVITIASCCLLTQCNKIKKSEIALSKDLVGTHQLHGIYISSYHYKNNQYADTVNIDSFILIISSVTEDSISCQRSNGYKNELNSYTLPRIWSNADPATHQYRIEGQSGIIDLQYSKSSDDITYFTETWNSGSTGESVKYNEILHEK
ncbi:MAG: hypothetical protein H6550_10800 [Chitinophagales bacterium]|nr:hypothetical protein [Chitinophagales bacterium]